MHFLKVHMIGLLLLWCSNQPIVGMDFFKQAAHKAQQQWRDYQKKQNIEKAFKALASNDCKTLAQLVATRKVDVCSENDQGVTLGDRLLETKNHRCVIPLIFGFSGAHALKNIATIRNILRNGPEYIESSVILPHDAQPLACFEIIAYGRWLVATYAPQSSEELWADDFASSLKNIHVIPYLVEKSLLYGYAAREKLAVKYKNDAIYTCVLPYLSPRAFESITNFVTNHEQELPKTTALIYEKHAEWKAMSKKRNELVRKCIYPCENIVREYLEGNEYQWMEYLLSKCFYDRWYVLELTDKIPKTRAFLQENLIMEYVGGFEYLQEQESPKLYNLIFQKLYGRFEAMQLHKLTSSTTIERPTQLIVDYCGGH